MNVYKGVVQEIIENGSLSRLKIEVGGVFLYSVVIESSKTGSLLESGETKTVIFKETEAIISKSAKGLAIENTISGKVRSIKVGKILTAVEMSSSIGPINSLMSTIGVDGLKLKIGNEVKVCVLPTQIMLS